MELVNSLQEESVWNPGEWYLKARISTDSIPQLSLHSFTLLLHTTMNFNNSSFLPLVSPVDSSILRFHDCSFQFPSSFPSFWHCCSPSTYFPSPPPPPQMVSAANKFSIQSSMYSFQFQVSFTSEIPLIITPRPVPSYVSPYMEFFGLTEFVVPLDSIVSHLVIVDFWSSFIGTVTSSFGFLRFIVAHCQSSLASGTIRRIPRMRILQSQRRILRCLLISSAPWQRENDYALSSPSRSWMSTLSRLRWSSTHHEILSN